MAYESRIEGLTQQQAEEAAQEIRLLGGSPEIVPGNGRFTVVRRYSGSPWATASPDEVASMAPAIPDLAPPSQSTKFADLAAEYQTYFDACHSLPQYKAAIDKRIERIRLGEDRYRALGTKLGMPWHFIGIIHSLECGCDFTRHLHNGDPLDQRTVRVPVDRPQGIPPFTWEASAEDALAMKGYAGSQNWSTPAMLYRWEFYNGNGYRAKQLPSPYLWSFSNLAKKGLYVADHQFDPEAQSKQPGAAVLLKALQGLP